MIPDYTAKALSRYTLHHLPPGDFLETLLGGDIERASHMTDLNNVLALEEIVAYIERCLPPESFGTPEKVKNWLKSEI
jgi:hypothetical protein